VAATLASSAKDESESPGAPGCLMYMPYVQTRAEAQYPACSSQLDVVHAQLIINKSSICSSGYLLLAPNVASRVLRFRPYLYMWHCGVSLDKDLRFCP